MSINDYGLQIDKSWKHVNSFSAVTKGEERGERGFCALTSLYFTDSFSICYVYAPNRTLCIGRLKIPEDLSYTQ